MSDLELAEIRKLCITSLNRCAHNISKYGGDNKDKEAQFNKLKSCVEQYCVQEAKQEVAIQALETAKNEMDSTNMETLQEHFTAHLSSGPGRQLHINHHPYMVELNKCIIRGMQSSRQNLDESDLAITESQDQYIDPITKRPIEDPVKNTICGHIYEKDSIMNLISVKTTTRCPVAGCGNRDPVQKQHLISDDELKFRMTLTQHSTMIQNSSVVDLDNSQQ